MLHLLSNFSPPKAGEYFPSLRNINHITYNIKSAETIADIIKRFGTKYIFPGNLETYRVGDFYVVLTNGTFNIYTTVYGTDSPTVFTSRTSLLPSIFTSFSFSSPSMTSGDTHIPQVSTIVIIYSECSYNLLNVFYRVRLSY